MQKAAEMETPQLSTLSINDSTASINFEFVVDPRWTGFKFFTKKEGAEGPTKKECEEYYSDR